MLLQLPTVIAIQVHVAWNDTQILRKLFSERELSFSRAEQLIVAECA